jgi:hypothetical protein
MNMIRYDKILVNKVNNIDKQPIEILIDLGSNHSYVNSKIFEIFQLQKSKHKKSWLVHLTIRAKRKISDLVKDFPIDMNGLDGECKHHTIRFI